MAKFGFIGHYLSRSHLSQDPSFGGVFHAIPEQFRIKMAQSFLSGLRLDFEKVKSTKGIEVEGIGIMCPFLPEDFVIREEKSVLRKISKAVGVAEQAGAKIISLGGFTSVVGNEGEFIARHTDVAVTSGNTYTVALILESIFQAARIMGVDPSHSTIAVIGATGDIGMGCLRVLVNHFKKIKIAARNENKLHQVAANISTPRCEIMVNKYISDSVKDADIVLSVASALTTILDPKDLLPGTIVCDAGLPHNISRDLAKLRNDLLVYDGGLCQLWYPYPRDARSWTRLFGTPRIVGCLAEAIILSLEEKYENYSLGRGNIIASKIEEIWQLGLKHGFQLAEFQSAGYTYTRFDLDRIKQAAIQTKYRRTSVFVA